MFSGPISRITAGTIEDIDTRCAGWAKDWATQSGVASKKAQEKSALVLMFVE